MAPVTLGTLCQLWFRPLSVWGSQPSWCNMASCKPSTHRRQQAGLPMDSSGLPRQFFGLTSDSFPPTHPLSYASFPPTLSVNCPVFAVATSAMSRYSNRESRQVRFRGPSSDPKMRSIWRIIHPFIISKWGKHHLHGIERPARPSSFLCARPVTHDATPAPCLPVYIRFNSQPMPRCYVRDGYAWPLPLSHFGALLRASLSPTRNRARPRPPTQLQIDDLGRGPGGGRGDARQVSYCPHARVGVCVRIVRVVEARSVGRDILST